MLVGKQDTLGFVLSLLGTLIIGSFTSVGSNTIIGFLKTFPADSISGFSSGTGLAGISGAGLYLIFSSLGLTFNFVVLILIPFAFIYLLNFNWILQLKARIDREVKKRFQGSHYGEEIAHTSSQVKAAEEHKEALINESLSMKTIKNVLGIVGGPLFNLSAVHFINEGLLP